MYIKNLYAASLILIFSGIAAGCADNDKKQDKQSVRYVLTEEVKPSFSNQTTSYVGVIEEEQNVNAAFLTGGQILDLKVKEGDRVKKGQLLAILDDKDYQIGVNQLKVQLDQLTNEKARMDEMYARHNVAPNDYEKLVAGYEQLKLQYQMAKNKLGYTRLYSPISGVVVHSYMQKGELVDAGTPIYKISDDSNLEVGVDVPITVYLNRKDISGAYGIVPVMSEEVPLKIKSFTPDADNNQLYHLKLSLPGNASKELTPGMNISVKLNMNVNSSEETLIPSRAIFDADGKQYVWVINEKDSTIAKKEVFVEGQPADGYSKIKGFDGNQRIVAAGVKQLKEGEKVIAVTSRDTKN